MGWFDIFSVFDDVGNFFGDAIGGWVGSEVVGAIAGEVIEGAIVGAITGAAYAAITGEDIGDAAFNGAIIGGITYGVIEGYDQWKNYTPDATVAISKKDPTPEVDAKPDTQNVEENSAFSTEQSIKGDTTGNGILKPPLPDAKKVVTDIVDSATSTSSLEKALTDLTKEVKEGKKFDWGTVIGQGVSGAANIYSSGKSDEAAAESSKELMAYQAELDAAKVAANQPAASTNYKLPSFGLETPEDYLSNFAIKLDAYKGILA